VPAHRVLATAVLAATLAVAGACGGGAPSDEVPTGSATTGGGVLVTTGVRYAAPPAGWVDPVLDLYAPADAGDAPVALVVPGPARAGASPDVVLLARDLAAQGVLAVVAHWGVERADLTAVAGRPLPEVTAQAEQTTAEVACALRAAVARTAVGQPGPDRPLVVVGHGVGADAAAMASLLPAPDFPTCFTAGVVPQVAAAVLWDGDWFGAALDVALGEGMSSFLPAYSPWPRVESLAMSTFVEVGVNANRLLGLAVDAGPTSSYVTVRDPAGAMTRDLEQVGAFDNGSLDPVDVARGFAVGLHRAGVQYREREVHGEGDPGTIGPRVRAMIVQSVVQLTTP
jgi:hypothetical protein